MPPGIRFFEYRLAIRVHLEPSALRRDQFDVGVRISLLKLGGQTGRPGLVASVGAVLNRDFHDQLKLVCSKYIGGAPPSVGGHN